MSAFICSDRHVATIAIFAAEGNLTIAQDVANILKRDNIRSVNYRYKKRNRIKPCDISDYWKEVTPSDIVALCNSLEYQSAHRPDYKGGMLGTIRNFAFRIADGKVSDLWSI